MLVYMKVLFSMSRIFSNLLSYEKNNHIIVWSFQTQKEKLNNIVWPVIADLAKQEILKYANKGQFSFNIMFESTQEYLLSTLLDGSVT